MATYTLITFKPSSTDNAGVFHREEFLLFRALEEQQLIEHLMEMDCRVFAEGEVGYDTTRYFATPDEQEQIPLHIRIEEAARQLAEQLTPECREGENPAQCLRRKYLEVAQTPLTPEERERMKSFLKLKDPNAPVAPPKPTSNPSRWNPFNELARYLVRFPLCTFGQAVDECFGGWSLSDDEAVRRIREAIRRSEEAEIAGRINANP